MAFATMVNGTGPLVDLRLLLATISTVAADIGFGLNGILIYLIFFKTSKLLEDYKIILIQNCFIDVFFTIVNDLGGMVGHLYTDHVLQKDSKKYSGPPQPKRLARHPR